MDAKIFIGKVHIVEWLRRGDRRTGWELFGEVQPMGMMSNPRVDVAFHSVATRVGFITVLRGIEDQFRSTGRLPLLHIETHGSDQGIGIFANEGFTFMELMDELIPLNGLTGLRLLVVVAACPGRRHARITPERHAIRRLYYGEHWKVGTIAAALGVHHDTAYELHVELADFKRYVQEDLVLGPGDAVALDVRLALGARSETVLVNTAAGFVP